jgi:hypothetical protein
LRLGSVARIEGGDITPSKEGFDTVNCAVADAVTSCQPGAGPTSLKEISDKRDYLLGEPAILGMEVSKVFCASCEEEMLNAETGGHIAVVRNL